MTLRARFGLFSHDRQTYLPGTDPALLPDPAGQDAPPHPDALAPEPYTPGADGAEALFDGRVIASTTRFGTVSARTVFDVVGAWNSVKNVAVASDGAADLAFVGFVHVDATLGLGSADDSSLEVVGAKRGNLVTGAGNDRITGEASGDSLHGDAGADTLSGGVEDDTLAGGEGDDFLAGDEGWDVATYAGHAAGYEVEVLSSTKGRVATVRDIDPADGDEGTDTLTDVERLRFADRTVAVPTLGAGVPGVVFLADNGGWDARATLWVSDGTAEGTVPFMDLGRPASRESGHPFDWVPLGDGQALAAVGMGYDGVNLWVTDGNGAGTRLVKAIPWGAADAVLGHPYGPVALGSGRALFAIGNGNAAVEFWTTDGTEAGTSVLASVRPGGGPGYPYGLVTLGDGRALFMAGDDKGALDLWATDGTAAGTAPVAALESGLSPWEAGRQPGGLAALGDGQAIFAAGNPATGQELWVSDGTAAGTMMVEDINPGDGSSYASAWVPLGDGRALFTASNGTAGPELWVTDGTAAGTTIVKDIHPGYSDTPREVFALGGGRALFSADDGVAGRELWVTDGTAAGTILLADIHPGPAYGFFYFEAAPVVGGPSPLEPLA